MSKQNTVRLFDGDQQNRLGSAAPAALNPDNDNLGDARPDRTGLRAVTTASISGKCEENWEAHFSLCAIAFRCVFSLRELSPIAKAQSQVGAATLMRILRHEERRLAPRRRISRLAKIKLETDTLPRDCLITDYSSDGERLYVNGFHIPDVFVLLIASDCAAQEGTYRVVWRLGQEVGAKFVSVVPRSGFAMRD
jgi:hypothetical protein